MSKRGIIAVVSLVLVSTSVLGVGGGTADSPGDDRLEPGSSTNATLLDRATSRVSELFSGGEVDVTLANGSGLDLSLSTPQLNVTFLNLGASNDSTTAKVTHEAITSDVETESNAGLCATGLSGERSPLNVSVDDETQSVLVIFTDHDPNPSSDPDSAFNATEVVQRCSTWNET